MDSLGGLPTFDIKCIVETFTSNSLVNLDIEFKGVIIVCIDIVVDRFLLAIGQWLTQDVHL